MNLTRPGLENPVAVAVGVLLVLLFGAISLVRLPVQLTPEVEQPEVTITTAWRAAAPEEVEAEITEPQEEVLRGLPGMTRLVSESSRGQSKVTITFAVGTDMQRALLEVLSRLNRVTRYPDDAGEPVISSVGGDSRPVAWFVVKPLPGNDRPVSTYQDFVEDVVQSRFERVPGVARSEVFGGRRREVRITFDPWLAANLGVELPEAARLAGSAKDVSGGFAEVGKRRYTLRFAGRYEVGELGSLIVDWREGRPVYLSDIAEVELRHADRRSFVIQNGEPSLAVNVRRPILMSTLTSIGGMLPLLVMPGAGTELYRGMAAVIVGGMTVSTVFTLILLPSLLRMGEETRTGENGRLGRNCLQTSS